MMTLKSKLRRREAKARQWRMKAFDAYAMQAPSTLILKHATRYAKWAKLADLTCQRVLEGRTG